MYKTYIKRRIKMKKLSKMLLSERQAYIESDRKNNYANYILQEIDERTKELKKRDAYWKKVIREKYQIKTLIQSGNIDNQRQFIEEAKKNGCIYVADKKGKKK